MKRLLAAVILSGLLFGGQRYYKRPLFSPASTSVCDDLPQTNLEACHDFLEDTPDTQTLTDRTGNGHDFTRGPTTGTESRDPSWVTGDRLDFTDGTVDEYVDGGAASVTYDTTTLFATSGKAFTVMIGAKLDDTGEFGVLLGKGNSGSSSILEININTFDRATTRVRGSNTDHEFANLGNWEMRTVSCTGTTCKYCYNGETDASCNSLNVGSISDVSERFPLVAEMKEAERLVSTDK